MPRNEYASEQVRMQARAVVCVRERGGERAREVGRGDEGGITGDGLSADPEANASVVL